MDHTRAAITRTCGAGVRRRPTGKRKASKDVARPGRTAERAAWRAEQAAAREAVRRLTPTQTLILILTLSLSLSLTQNLALTLWP